MELLSILRKAVKKPADPVTVTDFDKLIANARKIYNMDSMGGSYWGNSIKLSNSPATIISGTMLSVVGWKSSRPKPNDLLRMRMASGKVGLCIFVKVELCRDPADMFFGDVKMLGYDLNYK